MNIITQNTQTIPKSSILGYKENETSVSLVGTGTSKLLITAGETISLYDNIKIGSDGKAYKATNKVEFIALSPGAVGVQIEITKDKIIEANLGAVGNLYLNFASTPNSGFYQKIGTQINSNLAIINIEPYYAIV